MRVRGGDEHPIGIGLELQEGVLPRVHVDRVDVVGPGQGVVQRVAAGRSDDQDVVVVPAVFDEPTPPLAPEPEATPSPAAAIEAEVAGVVLRRGATQLAASQVDTLPQVDIDPQLALSGNETRIGVLLSLMLLVSGAMCWLLGNRRRLVERPLRAGLS